MTQHEKIKHTIEEFLTRMGIAFEEVSLVEGQDQLAFVIKSSESHLLIGSRGAHISALNHLIKRIAGKQLESTDQPLNFYVDINDYHDKLTREIKNKAHILAERARSFKTNVEMEPMSSYERMIVHTFFENIKDIETESTGVGSQRRIVLKYVSTDEGEKF
ncbi:MAG: hypothetical protein A3C06_03540 [Candidatus Taylorbacteria bacterium RIFCSPHIGHO2_02_FULL_46_13]|uniref:R3H domain-containing protein n=1 Tax=Candidatus Taylorbacteria bacterium RIFCSPHIGHO2_02_FULL_46_13 TaxID=1802312 RepID=A0A1G2MT46_9BACT|nr:MAG: hypothetical protein A3C06_03540 [Candidatus Taylorbacteria bacterium RIFCSPHIGHO2_02_FULL_46_13]